MFNKVPLTRLALLLLCAAWLFPGLVGHAPWKGGDGEHFVTLWAWQQHGMPLGAMPPLYYWAASATAWLTSPVLSLPDGARLASGLFVTLALAFVARAAHFLYGAESRWAAVLTLLGCVGLLVAGHELNAHTARLAAAAVMLSGMAGLPHGARHGWMLGGGAALMVLAGGTAEALLFLLLAAFLPVLLPDYRSGEARRGLLWGTAAALAFGAGWATYLSAQSIPLLPALDFRLWLDPSGLRPAYFFGILGWYAWPAWPLAVWAAYRGRRQWRTPGILLPILTLAALLLLYAFSPHPGEEGGLVLLLPLALLGAAGLYTLRRGAAYALLWFGVMLFSFIGLVFWVYWSAHDLGNPARLAQRLGKLGMTRVGELRPWALALGAVVTLCWVVFLVRVQRSPLRPMLVWTTGMTFIWVLLLALFQAPLDRRLSYAGVAAEVAARVPREACIQAQRVRSQQRLLLAYHSGRRLVPSNQGCEWLLVETRQRNAEPLVSGEWAKRWEGARPGDRADRFHLYVRR